MRDGNKEPRHTCLSFDRLITRLRRNETPCHRRELRCSRELCCRPASRVPSFEGYKIRHLSSSMRNWMP